MSHSDLGYTDEWLFKRIIEGIDSDEEYRLDLYGMCFDKQNGVSKRLTTYKKIKEIEMKKAIKTVVFSQEGIFIDNIPDNKVVRGIRPEKPIYRILVKGLALFGYIYLSDDIKLYIVDGEKRINGNNYMLSKIDDDDLMSVDQSSISDNAEKGK